MIDKIPARVRIGDDVISQTIEDEVVLLSLTSQEFFGLGAAGARIWELLTENGELALVEERLCRDYAGDRATIRSDFYAFVADLIESGLLKAADA